MIRMFISDMLNDKVYYNISYIWEARAAIAQFG